jgi:hypothetical protein
MLGAVCRRAAHQFDLIWQEPGVELHGVDLLVGSESLSVEDRAVASAALG